MIVSEREVARVLDELRVEWQYEPTLFIFEQDEKGLVRKGFRPDFYLPRYNLYLEVTMAKQANITKKNQKVRIAKELYPGTKIEIIYKRDFDNLKERILELIQAAKDTP